MLLSCQERGFDEADRIHRRTNQPDHRHIERIDDIGNPERQADYRYRPDIRIRKDSGNRRGGKIEHGSKNSTGHC